MKVMYAVMKFRVEVNILGPIAQFMFGKLADEDSLMLRFHIALSC